MPNIICNIANCHNNIDKECNAADIEMEDGYCKTKELDESSCSYCGYELINTKELSEHFGTPCKEDIWQCPNMCI